MLSRSSEYAIRALTFLAQREGDGRHHLARDMAEALGIPAPYLGKVLQPLVARGLLHSQRGRSGGFRLDRPAQLIPLVQIVEAQESLGAVNSCLLGQRDCDEAHACQLHDVWMNASNTLRERLTSTTLRDMVEYGATHGGCSYPFPSPTATMQSLPIARDERAVPA